MTENDQVFQGAMNLLHAEDYETAFRIFEALAKQGHANSQHVVAIFYKNGEGVEKDWQKMEYWLQKAANQGHKEAKEELVIYEGRMAVAGFLDLERNEIPQAIVKIKAGANAGDAFCQNALGLQYRDGSFIGGRDLTLARHWFKKAADQGFDIAQKHLNELGSTPQRSSSSGSSPVTSKGSSYSSGSSPVTSKGSSYSSSSSPKEKRGFLPSAGLGLVGGIGIYSIISRVYTFITGISFLNTIVVILIFAFAFIITFSAWRNRKTKLFIVLIVISAIGLLANLLINRGIIPETNNTLTEHTTGPTATITGNVNFRSGPSTNDSVIRQFAQGDTVTLTGETSGGWTQVSHNGDTGWVSSEFLNYE